MQRTLASALFISGCLLFVGCAPTMRQVLINDTADYTQCDHVDVDCVDEDCSNVAGGPWMATACATRYRCTRTASQVTCVPQPAATPHSGGAASFSSGWKSSQMR